MFLRTLGSCIVSRLDVTIVGNIRRKRVLTYASTICGTAGVRELFSYKPHPTESPGWPSPTDSEVNKNVASSSQSKPSPTTSTLLAILRRTFFQLSLKLILNPTTYTCKQKNSCHATTLVNTPTLRNETTPRFPNFTKLKIMGIGY